MGTRTRTRSNFALERAPTYNCCFQNLRCNDTSSLAHALAAMLRPFLAIVAVAALTLLARRLVSGAAPAAPRRGKQSSQLLSGDTFIHVPKARLLDEQLAAIAVPGGVNERLQARGCTCDAALSCGTLGLWNTPSLACRRRSWRGYRASATRGATAIPPPPALASSTPLLLLRAMRL